MINKLKFIPKVYTLGLNNPEIDGLTPLKNSEQFALSIKKILENVQKSSNGIDILKTIHSFLGELEKKSFSIDEVEIDSTIYHSLTTYSKKKFLVRKLIEKYPEKQERKNILSNAINIIGYDLDINEQLKGIGIDPVLINLSEIISEKGNLDMQQLSSIFIHDMDIEYQQIFINLLKLSGINKNIVNRFELYMGKNNPNKTIQENNSIMKTQIDDELLKIKTSNRKQTSDFNPLVYNLDLILGLKLFNFNRLKEIYKKFFYKIVLDLLKHFGGVKPSFNKLLYIQKDKFKEFNEDTKNNDEEKYIYQFTIEWHLPNNFSEENLIEIVKMLNLEGLELNTISNQESKHFNHPVKTDNGVEIYNGHFDNNGDGFLGESLIIIENKKTKLKKLRLTLNNFNQDNYTYFLSQISYYINNLIFINKNQLYFNIYDKYNKEMYDSSKNYNIDFFEKQYIQLMENLIIPLSNEGLNSGIKAHNTLLAGIYGSGKSQFLLKILKDKKFKLNGKEFNLNANVIHLDLQSFKALLSAPIGGIRTKLDEIYQNTNTPILLVIEDIDTLINERLSGQNDEIAQAMTVFFEGIGSIPINIIATANEPSKLSERLIRPNRIYEIIEFYLPSKKEKKQILELHLIENGIKLSNEIINTLMKTKVFKEGTASHISAFCSKLKSKIKIEQTLGNKNYILSDDIILEIAENMNISCKDIEETIIRIQEWVSNVTGNGKAMNIGF